MMAMLGSVGLTVRAPGPPSLTSAVRQTPSIDTGRDRVAALMPASDTAASAKTGRTGSLCVHMDSSSSRSLSSFAELL